MKMKQAIGCASAVSLALVFSTAFAEGDTKTSTTDTSTQASQPMTGKQKATAIGAGTGAVAGAVVGGPVGAVAGAVVGGVVGHEGTDANGKVTTPAAKDGSVRNAQAALNNQGYSVEVDGQWGPNTQAAVRRFQADHNIAPSGKLDNTTMAALGVNH